ncbi:unnamed protein product [Rodentolepis nana]|uniref:Conserved secreted protein n=1 Tax=Rodentolepis nana TaxID=102285 RepID=A0A0R3THH3_RODNA|nr:unnamed protein product [Rodentolepis nana]
MPACKHAKTPHPAYENWRMRWNMKTCKMSPILLLFLVALARAQYLVDETEGCVTINVTLPGPYTVLRIDQTDYIFDGESYCTKEWNENDAVECTLAESK